MCARGGRFNLRRLPPSLQDAKASTAAGSHSGWSPVHLQRGSTGRRRVHVGPQAQVSLPAGVPRSSAPSVNSDDAELHFVKKVFGQPTQLQYIAAFKSLSL